MPINLQGLANSLRIALVGIGVLCIIFLSFALHADRTFNSEMESSKTAILENFVNKKEYDGRFSDEIWESRLIDFLYEHMRDNLTGARVWSQRRFVTETFDGYQRCIRLSIASLVITVIFTVTSGLTNIARISNYINRLTDNSYAEIYFGVSTFGFTIACVLEMIGAIDLEQRESASTFPFDCSTGFDPTFEFAYVCQLYGVKIFAGAASLTCGIISAILVVIFVIIRSTVAPSTSNSASRSRLNGIPTLRIFETKAESKLGKLLTVDDLVDGSQPQASGSGSAYMESYV